jgi:hypothetical protein
MTAESLGKKVEDVRIRRVKIQVLVWYPADLSQCPGEIFLEQDVLAYQDFTESSTGSSLFSERQVYLVPSDKTGGDQLGTECPSSPVRLGSGGHLVGRRGDEICHPSLPMRQVEPAAAAPRRRSIIVRPG